MPVRPTAGLLASIEKPALGGPEFLPIRFVLPFTSLIRVNPQGLLAAGEMTGPVVLGEAGRSPTEKKNP
jgi:hypothetical protein